mgnify:CR=1 FL=1
MNTKKIITLVSLAVILVVGLLAVFNCYRNIPIAYDGSDVNVVDLYNDPENFDVSNPDGVASIIVQENLSKTMAANNVAAIVFDFRGYDTMGEAFILITAVAGSIVILYNGKKKEKKEDAEDGK